MKRLAKNLFILVTIIAVAGGLFFAYHYIVSESAVPSVDDVDETFSTSDTLNYYYSQLSTQNQEIYKTIYYAYTTFQESVVIENSDAQTISTIADYVMNDHPELYYIDPAYSYINDTKFVFYPAYYMTQDEVDDMEQQLSTKLSTVIDQAEALDDEISQAKYIYDYIVENVTYVVRDGEDQTMTSALIDQQSVCAGYARAYQYLLNQIGIECTYIPGTAIAQSASTSDNLGHAWNMVKINDNYYYCDLTWADCEQENYEHTCRAYFMMTSDEMLACYEPKYSYYELTANYATNYFENIGCYIDDEAEEKDILSNAVQSSLDQQNGVAEIKCANTTIYQDVLDAIANDGLAYEVLNENNCWSNNSAYNGIDELLVIELYY